MKTICLLFSVGFLGLVGCDVKVSNPPADEKTTIVNPPAKEEHTTIINTKKE